MNIKRMRGRNHRPNNGGGNSGSGGFRNQQNGIPLNRNHVFDSSGPEMRVRGTAQQLHEKYTQLARDASSNGDRVTGEAYYQHAEHYFRIISAINQAQNQNGQQAPQQNSQQPNHYQAPSQNSNGNGYQSNGQSDYSRRNEPYGADTSSDVASEARYQESRQHETRSQEPRHQEPRRHEQRPYEPRNKPEFQRTERYRLDAPVIDTRIDISSALEAELAAASAQAAALGEQPVAATAPVAETRAIPIIPDAPPETSPARLPRPRGRPKMAKSEATFKTEE